MRRRSVDPDFRSELLELRDVALTLGRDLLGRHELRNLQLERLALLLLLLRLLLCGCGLRRAIPRGGSCSRASLLALGLHPGKARFVSRLRRCRTRGWIWSWCALGTGAVLIERDVPVAGRVGCRIKHGLGLLRAERRVGRGHAR